MLADVDAKNGQDILDLMSTIKPILVDRYTAWSQSITTPSRLGYLRELLEERDLDY